MSDKGQAFFAGRSVLVLGAGYVGSALALRARDLGAEVCALTRNQAMVHFLETEGIRTICAELQADSWHSLAGRADFVLVSVGSGGGGGGVEAYRRSYQEGMASVRRWASERFVDTLVYTSSTSVYSQGAGALVTEEFPTVDFGAGTAGVLAEVEHSIQPAVTGVRRSFVLRLAGIYGPGRHFFLDKLRSAPLQLAGEPGGHLNLIHRDDIVAAVLACWRAPYTVQGQVFNLADEGRATRGEIARWLAERIEVPDTAFTSAPAPGRSRVTPDRIISAARIRELLDWRPRYPSFREGYEMILQAK